MTVLQKLSHLIFSGGGLTPWRTLCDFTIANLANAYNQGSTITIKSPYVCQTFGVRDVRGQIPEIIYQVSYLLPSDFPNNFS